MDPSVSPDAKRRRPLNKKKMEARESFLQGRISGEKLAVTAEFFKVSLDTTTVLLKTEDISYL